MPLGLLYHRRCVGRPGEAVGDVYPQKSGKNAFFLNVCHVYVAGLAQRHQEGLFIVLFCFLEVLSVRRFTVHHSDSLFNTSLYDDTFALRTGQDGVIREFVIKGWRDGSGISRAQSGQEGIPYTTLSDNLWVYHQIKPESSGRWSWRCPACPPGSLE